MSWKFRLATFWRKNEGLSCVFSSAGQTTVCKIKQIRLSAPSQNITWTQCFEDSASIDSPARDDRNAEALCESGTRPSRCFMKELVLDHHFCAGK